MNKRLVIDILTNIFGCILLSVAFYISLCQADFSNNIVPYAKFVYPITNLVCLFLCLFIVFFPQHLIIKSIILVVQSFLTTLNGYDFMGTFLYSNLIIILFLDGFFITKIKQKTSILATIWIFIACAVIPYGIYRFIRMIALSFYIITFYLYVYYNLESILSTFIPANLKIENNDLPKPGSTLYLKNYNLTERQVSILKTYLENESPYSEIADKHNISVSLVKREMSLIFTQFKVKNLKELHFLLLQYVIK